MAKITKPARKRKGPPPAEDTTSTNLKKSSDNAIVPMNFKVPSEFRKTMKQYAAELGVSMTDLMITAVEEYKRNH
jgi:hypothetical protein